MIDDVTNYFHSKASAKKKQSKIPSQTASSGISREQFKQGSRNFTNLSTTTCPQSCQIWRHLLLPVAAKCNYVPHKSAQNGSRWTNSRLILPRSNLKSPKLARTARLTYCTAIADTTSPAASGRPLFKFENDRKRCIRRQRVRHKRRGVSPHPTLWWLLDNNAR